MGRTVKVDIVKGGFGWAIVVGVGLERWMERVMGYWRFWRIEVFSKRNFTRVGRLELSWMDCLF